MAWEFQTARDNFDSHRDNWDAFNKSRGHHLLLDSDFIGPLIRHFGSAETLLAISDDEIDSGMVILEPVRPCFWQTFQPAQAPLGPLIFQHIIAKASDILSLMSSLPGYVLGFSVTQQDPDFTCFENLTCHPLAETVAYIKTPRLRISGSFDAYWKSRSRNLTHNLSRQRRRLKEQRRVIELVADRDVWMINKLVEEYARLESTGWKGKSGTAVSINDVQSRFYKEMLVRFCNRGEGVIYRLLLDGKTVASDLCLQRKGSLVILKTAYDESIEGLSLGLLLHEEVFKCIFQEGNISAVEFYGPVKDWHKKWTNEVRTMYHINFYRHRWVSAVRSFYKTSLSGLRHISQ